MSALPDRVRLFNIRELAAHRGRTAAMLGVVAVSAALLVAVLGISGSVTGSVERLSASIGGNADLEVSGITDAGFGQSIEQAVATTPGVAASIPMIRTVVGPERVLLVGTGPNAGALDSDLQRSVRDAVGKLLTVPNGVLAGAGLGYHEGERFDLGATKVTVAAVIDAPATSRINGGRFVLTSLPLAQQITNRPNQLDSILIVEQPGADVRAAVTATIDGRAIVAEPSFRAAQASSAVAILHYMTLLGAIVALIVAAFLVYNAMSMAISQRRPVISMLRAIGGKRRVIVRDLLAEAALVGLAGGLFGSALGLLMGKLAIEQIPAGLVASIETRTEYIVPLHAIPVAVLACIAASVVAAAIAARQVYKVAPVEALAPVGTSTVDRAGPVGRAVAGVLGIAGMAASFVVATRDIGQVAMAAVAASFLGSLAFSYALTGPTVAGAARIARVFGAPGALAAATVERAPRRTWVTAVTVSIAVTMTVSITGSNTNTVDSVTDSFAAVANSDVEVAATSPDSFPTELLPPDTEARIRAVPGVADVVPGQLAFATIGTTRVMVQGVAPGPPVVVEATLSDAQRTALAAGEGVVVSKDVARAMNVAAGESLEIPTPSGVKRMPVIAVVPYFSVVAGVVAMNLTTMQDWFDRPGASVLGVVAAQGVDRSALKAAVQQGVSPDLHVVTGDEALAGVTSGVSQATVLVRGIAWIVVLVAAVALFNTLMLSILERRRELGVLRAMGSSRKFALRAVLAEAAGIGLVGGLFGLIFGVLNQFLDTIALTNVIGIDVRYEPNPTLLLIAAGALVVCLVGALPPAARAARLRIVDAIAVG